MVRSRALGPFHLMDRVKLFDFDRHGQCVATVWVTPDGTVQVDGSLPDDELARLHKAREKAPTPQAFIYSLPQVFCGALRAIVVAPEEV